MRLRRKAFFLLAATAIAISGCKKESDQDDEITTGGNTSGLYPAVEATFGGSIDLNHLLDYGDGGVPNYITQDNTNGNFVTDAGATLGRVLFYDTSLSVDYTISCSSCHQQANAFSDAPIVSTGVDGFTGRHSMRLVNPRFAEEDAFFWDERAFSLEEQTTMPVQDHIEMGWSGEDGDPSFDDLIDRLAQIDYYQELFAYVYGSSQVTEDRIQWALAQFIRSIQSFDSKYDIGRATAQNDGVPFVNFTTQENTGKQLFLAPATLDANNVRTGGGVGCAGCHRPPEFDIDPASLNNGVTGVAGSAGEIDLTNTRAPSLRDVMKADGTENGPFMHDGSLATLSDVIDHYDLVPVIPENNNLDPRVAPAGIPRDLQITDQEKAAVIAFLATLSGENIYVDEKWSNPF